MQPTSPMLGASQGGPGGCCSFSVGFARINYDAKNKGAGLGGLLLCLGAGDGCRGEGCAWFVLLPGHTAPSWSQMASSGVCASPAGLGVVTPWRQQTGEQCLGVSLPGCQPQWHLPAGDSGQQDSPCAPGMAASANGKMPSCPHCSMAGSALSMQVDRCCWLCRGRKAAQHHRSSAGLNER